MKKTVTLKHIGLRCEGTAIINHWGGGQSEVKMDGWNVDTDIDLDKCVHGVNDGQFGCESIESATVRVYDLYENNYAEYSCTICFEAEQLKKAKKGI